MVVASKTVGGITPSTIIVIAVFLSLTAVAAAMVDKRGRVGLRHFDLWRSSRMRTRIVVYLYSLKVL